MEYSCATSMMAVTIFSSTLEAGDNLSRSGLHLANRGSSLWSGRSLAMCFRFEIYLFSSHMTSLSGLLMLKEFDEREGIGMFHMAGEFPRSLVGFGSQEKNGTNFK